MLVCRESQTEWYGKCGMVLFAGEEISKIKGRNIICNVKQMQKNMFVFVTDNKTGTLKYERRDVFATSEDTTEDAHLNCVVLDSYISNLKCDMIACLFFPF